MSKKKERLKKIASLMLSLIMILSMGMTVLAEGDGSAGDPFIGEGELNDTELNGSITIHKFDMAAWENKMNEEPRPIGAEEEYWITYFGNSALGMELQSGDEVGYYYLTQQDEDDDTNRQIVYLNDLLGISELSDIIFHIQSAEPKEDKEGSSEVGDYDTTTTVSSYGKTKDGIMKWTGVPKGYYIVTELANESTESVIPPFVISVPMMDPTATDLDDPKEIKDIHIYPKNKLKKGPNVEKEITSNLENGNVVSWLVIADVPEDIATSRRYDITDTMSAGLDYVADSLVIKSFRGTTELRTLVTDNDPDTDDYTADITPGDDGASKLKISLTDAGRQKLGEESATEVRAAYDTVVNLSPDEWAALVEKAVDNNVILEFQNGDGRDYEEGPGPVEVEDFAGLEIMKKDGATEEPLAGVKFKIYTALNQAGDDVDPASVLKNSSGGEATIVTGTDGIGYYYGLGEGTYYLVESETVGSYKKLTGFLEFIITSQMAEDHEVFDMEVLNYLDNGITLPKTGGMGTLMFTIAGLVLIIAAGSIYLITRKRKR